MKATDYEAAEPCLIWLDQGDYTVSNNSVVRNDTTGRYYINTKTFLVEFCTFNEDYNVRNYVEVFDLASAKLNCELDILKSRVEAGIKTELKRIHETNLKNVLDAFRIEFTEHLGTLTGRLK